MANDLTIQQLEMNIDSLKSQLKILTEQMERWSQYKIALVEGAQYVFEVNVSKNSFLVKQPELYSDLKISYDSSYTDMLKEACKTKVHKEDAANVFKELSPQSLIEVYNRGELQKSFEYRRCLTGNEFGWVRFSAFLIKNQSTGDIYALIIIKNITNQKVEELNLIDRAQHDSLTKLYNRSSMETLIKEVVKNKNAHHALIIFDIDNFKKLNDTNGHQFGDNVLVKFAFLLNSVFHKNDIIARIGGDEFIVFATNITQETLMHRANEVLEGCTESFPPEILGIKITPSIGAALFPEHGTTLAELYPRADTALYYSKENGKNRITMYNSNMKKN